MNGQAAAFPGSRFPGTQHRDRRHHLLAPCTNSMPACSNSREEHGPLRNASRSLRRNQRLLDLEQRTFLRQDRLSEPVTAVASFKAN